MGDESCGSKEQCVIWDQDRTNPFVSARGDQSTMRPFAKLLWTFVVVVIIIIIIIIIISISIRPHRSNS